MTISRPRRLSILLMSICALALAACGQSSADRLHNRATYLREQGNYGQAVVYYTESLKRKPGMADSHNDRGFSYYKMGKFDLALKDFNKAQQINPKLPYPYLNRGNVYKRFGDAERAAADWQRSIQIRGTKSAMRWKTFLKTKGHYTGAVDGTIGPELHEALLACAKAPDCDGFF